MQSIMKLFSRPIAPTLTVAEITSSVLHGIGPVALVVGILVLPSLQLTEVGFYFALLALVGFMLLAYIAGQVTIIADELKRTRSEQGDRPL